MSAALASTTSAASSSTTRTLTNRGTTSFTAAPVSRSTAHPKLSRLSQYVNRSLSRNLGPRSATTLTPPVVPSTPVDNATPGLTGSFEGLNAHDNGDANGFDLEPPDQGMCVGNGYILETINDVLQVYNTSGGGITTATSLNAFYHEDPSVAFVTDPSCYYDHDIQTWFHVVLTLDTDPSTGALTGGNHIDLAVSKTSNPAGTYNLYSFQVSDDGTFGQPTHPNCPCIGDFPHIGADKYGFYVTTNEYSFSVGGPNFGFNTAQLYAMSKAALAQGFSSVQVIHFDNLTVTGAGTPAFTMWPASSPALSYATGNGGTEYFMSSMATGEANNFTGFDNRLGVWALTNTQALEGGGGSPILTSTTANVETYGIPAAADQKAGPVPMANCLNHPSCATALFGGPDPYHEVEGPLDSSDTRILTVIYATGKLYGALDTVVQVNGVDKAGVAYFVLRPSVTDVGIPVVSATLVKQGYLANSNNNVIFPAIGVTTEGKAIMAFNIVGANYYPSHAFTSLDTRRGTGTIHIAAAGVGPQDGFSEYQAFGNPPRPRWGDYGAAAVAGGQVYIASEYIAQSCILAQYQNDPTCGGTRDKYANWSTRISSITP